MGAAASAWIGLGSNVGDGTANLAEAVRRIRELTDVDFLAMSSLYQSEPWGRVDQDDFTNAVMAVSTTLSPRSLLEVLLAVELAMGRQAGGERWGPRVIDLDLLLYGCLEIEEEGLVLPHPRMHLRRFVLEPLEEISPGLQIPGVGRVSDRLPGLAGQDLVRLGSP